jgi:zinc D-Ala-D-Ala carboxypeptidase
MKLSKNFTKAELCKSQTATRMGLNNNPTDDQTENLRLLCERVLQPVRDHFNQVVTISSGFRDPILSVKIGSSTKSQHINANRKEYLMAIKGESGKTEYKQILGLSTDRYVK